MSHFQPSPAYRIFLDLLVKERQRRNLTQDELGGRLSLSHTQVAAFESGRKQLDFVQTREWCLALGVSFLDFMVGLDREITKQLPDAFTTPAPEADAPDVEQDDPYGVAHHVLPHVPAPESELKEGGPMSRTFTPGPAYRVFLAKLYEARLARGHSLEQLSEIIGLTPAQIAAYEAGAVPLTFTDVRNWLLALDVPFVTFARELNDALDSTLTTDEGITFPGDIEPEPDRYARAEPLPHQVPSIQVLFFAPGAAPEVRRIENTLEAKQAIVEGLITTFETGVSGTIGIANDEALLEDMPFNRQVPATGGQIFGPFLVAGDVDGGFRSLAPLELERALDMLCPEIGQEQFATLVATLDGGAEWMEMWN